MRSIEIVASTDIARRMGITEVDDSSSTHEALGTTRILMVSGALGTLRTGKEEISADTGNLMGIAETDIVEDMIGRIEAETDEPTPEERDVPTLEETGVMILEGNGETIPVGDMTEEGILDRQVSSVTAKADRAATVFLDGKEGVPPDKFYILGSAMVEVIHDDEETLEGVINNGSEDVIIDEGLAVRPGLDLDRSYRFEIETAAGKKQKVTGVCHKAAIEVDGLRIEMPVFAVKGCNSELLLGRT
ncbi:hypothetical protein CBR_g64844 [Chara braunii]|uniref:Uncharacterized protein n=1 Tax=Chara braunii TaxID=69332 RepID=A0A388K935_CHABU|nr:hypothetical protein CBR_g64844 [Chara braunii]|eukprot:GBG66572.1 hypothetical protein CBR_g64844 [Chara braunii]